MQESSAKVMSRLESMLKIRRFEERLIQLHSQGAFPGHYHENIGQEATAVAVVEVLRETDLVFTTHRNHGHLLARGAEPGKVLAEIFGKLGGYNHGKGGTLHIASSKLGIPTTSAIVGGNLPIAVGAALSLKRLSPSSVVVSFFGDGVLEEGAFYEALNLAGLWRVPVFFICENNSVPVEKRKHGQYPSSTHAATDLWKVPEAFGIKSSVCDGAEVPELFRFIGVLIQEVRDTISPHFLEVRNTRWPGSVDLWPSLLSGETDLRWALGVPDLEPPDEWYRDSDPLLTYLALLIKEGTVSMDEVLQSDRKVREAIEKAVQFAINSPFPPVSSAYSNIFAEEGLWE
jgi:pyruvate dehydrogenase E1 component alpha subunit